MPCHRFCFSLIRILCQVKLSMADSKKNLAFDLTFDVIIGMQIKLCNIFEKFMPVAIKYRLWIENWSLALADSSLQPPPPTVGTSVWKYPNRVRVSSALKGVSAEHHWLWGGGKKCSQFISETRRTAARRTRRCSKDPVEIPLIHASAQNTQHQHPDTPLLILV